MTAEHKIQNDIRVAVSRAGNIIFRANVGKVKMDNGGWFDAGLPKGFPDLFGFRKTDGKIFFIECKNETGRLREDQKKFAKAIDQYPVLYGVARSVDDALGIIRGEKNE
ncbi:VRR-NUC domain-containing protein [Loigolactobacillus backii]|uniref:VRR-NUC domain-containing protein n=1 Tax=Loigolactobacillus backii TaxID=375175 RepID=UPI0007F0BC57|nr:VRR-NUC domain-containing protein [Loigolactobacillus backii]ANK60046.1 hypothetical protein AYR52_07070 [Loigolactobacillus backii]